MRKAISIVVLVLGGAALLAAQRQNSGATSPGQPIYESHCAGCHGLDGHGSQQGPNIATVVDVQNLSDAQLTQIVHDGHTGGMPGFGSMLSDSDITAVVSYLRELQHRGGPAIQGNTANGKTIFFGSGGCSQCHMIRGQGGFLGSDLTGAPLSPDDIRNAILNPAASPTAILTTVIMKNGQKISGLVKDEDNFSIQMLSEKGALVSIEKSDTAKIDRAATPLMPSDYGTRLTPSDLQDLVAYLASQAGSATDGRGGRGRRGR
jgi:cytochrome c oxidase cbb3-type subunit III